MKVAVLALLAVTCFGQTLPNAVPTPTPIMQFLDQNGKPLVGAKLCTYAAGTSTPQATYTSYTAGTPNTNPVIADAGGRVQVWIGALSYKFVLRSGGTATGCNDGAIVWTADHVQDTALYFVNFVKTAGTATLITYTDPLTGGVARTVSSRLAEEVYVKDFGAVCDGSTDDHAAIQTAINGVIAAGNGGFVLLPPAICNIGTVGISITNGAFPQADLPGVSIKGQGRVVSKLTYSGTGSALTVGVANNFIFRNSFEDFTVDITSAGVSAIGANFITSHYTSWKRMQVRSEYNSATSRQIALQLTGGTTDADTFGAFFKWDESEIRGHFYRGVYMSGERLGWGFNSCQFIGGSITNNGAPVSGTIGLWMHQGTQNVIENVDVENWSTGIRSDAFDNTFLASRTEGNTAGMLFSAPSDPCCPNPTDTTGGSYNRVFGGAHGDGITDNTLTTLELWATFAGNNFTNRLRGFVYLDTPFNITDALAIIWQKNGGSAGMFWQNNTGMSQSFIYTDTDNVTHLGTAGVDYLTYTTAEEFAGGLQIPVGIFRNSTGFQHFSFPTASTCTTAASAGATCDQTITWNTTWVDTNYTPICSPADYAASGTGVPIIRIDSKSTTQLVIKIVAATAVATHSGFDCVGIHW